MMKQAALLAVAALSSQLALAQARSGKYDRTEPFTVDYTKGRTWQGSYANDPNTLARKQRPIAEVCHASRSFDFEVEGLGAALSKLYFGDKNYDGTNVIVHVSIPLQKMFVLERAAFEAKGDGLVYAWRTSTGYHDKHWASPGQFGQKGIVQIDSKDRASALTKLKTLGRGEGAKYIDDGTQQYVVFDKKPGKRVEYKEYTTKLSRERAAKLGVEIVGEDSNNPNLLVVKKYSLRYSDYFHSEPGFFRVGNAFSSRHISGESDASLETEVPFMSWAIFFNMQRGAATHGAAYRGTLGSPGSHGCIRLLEENACRLFHLIGKTEYGQVPFVNSKTGTANPAKLVNGHRALYVISDSLNAVETRFQSDLAGR